MYGELLIYDAGPELNEVINQSSKRRKVVLVSLISGEVIVCSKFSKLYIQGKLTGQNRRNSRFLLSKNTIMFFKLEDNNTK